MMLLALITQVRRYHYCCLSEEWNYYDWFITRWTTTPSALK